MSRRRFLRAVALPLSALLLCLSLSGCGLYELLGIDTHDYETEDSLNTLALDGEVETRKQPCRKRQAYADCRKRAKQQNTKNTKHLPAEQYRADKRGRRPCPERHD